MIEGLAGAQAIALQLSYLVGLAQRPQHAEGGPGSDVAADAHPHLVLPAGGQAEQPAAEKQIRRRAEGDCGPGVMQALPLGIIEMDPVSEDAAFASELIVMIDIQIARMLRPQLFNPGDLLRFSLRCVCSQVSGNSARRRCTASSNPGVEVGAKRGVMA